MTRPQAFDKTLEYSGGMKFAAMTRRQKLVFTAQVVVCVVTFGFVFPNVQSS